MNSTVRKRVVTAAINTILSCAVIGAFILWCSARGRIGSLAFPYLAELVWLFLVAWTCLLWLRELRSVLLTVIGAVITVAMWSLSAVDFPPPLIERNGALNLAVTFSPVLFAAIVGAAVSEDFLFAGGLMLLLGVVGVFPVAIWNEDTHVIGGWAEYGCSALALVAPIITGGLGTGGAALGHFVRKRVLK